jgi:hypothetical protein
LTRERDCAGHRSHANCKRRSISEVDATPRGFVMCGRGDPRGFELSSEVLRSVRAQRHETARNEEFAPRSQASRTEDSSIERPGKRAGYSIAGTRVATHHAPCVVIRAAGIGIRLTRRQRRPLCLASAEKDGSRPHRCLQYEIRRPLNQPVLESGRQSAECAHQRNRNILDMSRQPVRLLIEYRLELGIGHRGFLI